MVIKIRRLCVSIICLLIFLFLSFPLNAQDVTPAVPSDAAAHRPRVGLALSGGGALGLAEIGVIQWKKTTFLSTASPEPVWAPSSDPCMPQG